MYLRGGTGAAAAAGGGGGGGGHRFQFRQSCVVPELNISCSSLLQFLQLSSQILRNLITLLVELLL